MIAINNHDGQSQTSWQVEFVHMLPQIERLLRHVFHHLDPERRDEAVQSATVFCLLSYMRLHERGCAGSVTPSSLVWYAALQVKCGRPAGGRMNVRDPLSPYAQRRRGIKVERLQTYDPSEGHWIDAIVADKRASVVEIVAARLDIRTWLATLSRRNRNIAADLARGCTTWETALKYRLSAGRISQLRRELEESWNEFQHESELALAS